MVILFTNMQDELMVEIGTIEKSHVFSIMHLLLNGLKNSLSQYYTEEEINENFNEWSYDLGQELYLREINIKQNDIMFSNLTESRQVLENLPKNSNHTITINQLIDYQKQIISNNKMDLKTCLFPEVNNLELSYKGQKIKFVKQQHKTSCTIACMSMITGEDYNKVFNKMREKYQLKRYFSTNEIQWTDYLREFGYSLGEKQKVHYWKEVPDYAICIVEGTEYYKKSTKDIRHAILFRREHGLIWLLDSEFETPIYDFWNYHMNLSECYEIKK